MNEFLPKNSKEEIIKTMMRHPDTAKLIKEALSSPVGSTSRAKAQKLFSIMNKLGSSHDGMGGPGMIDPMSMYMGNPTQPVQAPTREPKNMVVFKKIPKPKINYGGNSTRVSQRYDGSGGPGIYDGQGGLWDSVTNTISTFTKPFTDYLSGSVSYTAPQQPLSSPAPSSFSVPKTTATSQNSSMIPNMSTVNGPVYSAPPKTTTTQTQPTSTWEPGLIPKVGDWIANTAVPNVGKTALSLAGAIPAVAQYVAQNTAELPFAAYRTLIGQDPTRTNQPGPGFVSLGDTWASKQIASLWPNITSPTTSSRVSQTLSQAPSAYGPVQSGAQTPQQNTTTSSSGAPSFYASLSGNVTTPSGNNSYNSPYGASNQYSGGASGSYSGGASGSFIDRLIATESGGNYQAVGPVINNGGQNDGYAALGKYQIMPNLHFASIGLDANNQEDVQKFLQTPELQDQLFSMILGDLSTKYGGDEAKIAAAYFGGDRAAQAYGTPLGDEIGDGNMSVNQYVNALLGGSGASTPSSLSSLQAAARAAVEGGYSSPTTFAMEQMLNPDNPITKGLLYSQALEENRKTIWDAFNLDENKARIEALQKEVTALPKDMTDYISARDTYIKETDKAIDDYMKQMDKMDMSNPVVAKQATSHLNYLYTLRGRQNQSYMGYLNEAVVNHETKLNNAIDDYNSKLALAETELTSANEMTREMYTMYSQSLSELYTEVQNAPIKALELQALKNQVYSAAGTGATDQAAFDAKQGYFKQRDLMRGSVIDDDLLAIPGTNLVDQIGRISWGDPSIMQDNVLRAYEEGVSKFMWSPDDEKSGITAESKRQIAEEGIRNFAQVAQVGMNSGNDAAVTQGLTFATTIADNLAKNIGQNTVSIAPGLMESVKTLSPSGSWYTFGLTRKPTPTMEQFVNTVKENTGDNALSESIAKAVYAVFLRYMQEPGSTPEGAVYTMLNRTSSTSDRSGATPYTPQEFSNIIGRMYAEDILMREFGINPQLQQAMQMSLYQ